MSSEPERIVIAPGPVHVPAALRERVRPMHHRSGAFRKIFREIETMLRELLGTSSPVYTLTASGTGAMEAAVANTVRADDSVLVVSGGKFGDRWEEILSAYGCNTRMLSFEPGAKIDIESVAAAAAECEASIVACTHVESSTGLLLDIESLASRLNGPLLMVDAIASLGAEELSMDDWGLDIVVSASQKAFASPPGVSFLALSDRARKRAKEKVPYYLDLSRYEEGRELGDAPFTPAIDSIQMVHTSLLRASETGWNVIRERHRMASGAFTEAMKMLSIQSLPESPSSAVLAFVLPDGCDGESFLELLEKEHGIIAAGGQGSLNGKIFRTGFLGHFRGETLLRIVRSIAGVLSELNVNKNVKEAEKAIGKLSDFPGFF